MNKVFKVIWSHISQQWVVVSEHAKSHGKSKKSHFLKIAAAIPLMVASFSQASDPAVIIQNQNHELQQPGKTWNVGSHGYDSLQGVEVDSPLSGMNNIVFEAPKAGLNVSRVSRDIIIEYDKVPDYILRDYEALGVKLPYNTFSYLAFNTGHDDRYGRKIYLTSQAPNDYIGETIVRNNAYLYVGHNSEKDRHLLGDTNPLSVLGYSVVALYSHENVSTLLLDAEEAARIDRDEKDPDTHFFGNLADRTGNKEDYNAFYSVPNSPVGGVIYLTQGSALTVENGTTFKGNKNFTVLLSAHEAKLHLKEKGDFDKGQMHLNNETTATADKDLSFIGSNSGFYVANNSEFTVNGKVTKQYTKENDGYGYFSVSNNSNLKVTGDVDINHGSLAITDGTVFAHESGYPEHRRIQNQPVQGIYKDISRVASTASIHGDVKFSGNNNRFVLLGSNFHVQGDFKGSESLKIDLLGGNVSVTGQDGFYLADKSDAVMLANKMNLQKFEIAPKSLILAGSNDITVQDDFTLAKNVSFLDATFAEGDVETLLADGREQELRLHFANDHAHHGLTYNEFLNVLSGNASNAGNLGNIDSSKLVYDIANSGSLLVWGNTILKEQAIYEALGSVEIDKALQLENNAQFIVHRGNRQIDKNDQLVKIGSLTIAPTANFAIHDGDVKIAKGSNIEGKISFDQGKRLSFESGELSFAQDQDLLAGNLHIANSGTSLKLVDRNLVNKTGTITIDRGAILKAEGNNHLQNLINSGDIYIGSAVNILETGNRGDGNAIRPTGTLIVNGDYIGIAGSTIHFGDIDVIANEDQPLSVSNGYKDLLWIKGNASGESYVSIDGRLKDIGKLTKKGILLAHIEGDSTLNLSFKPGMRVTDGGTEYLLVGRAEINDPDMVEGKNSWYLSNIKEPILPPVIKEPEVTPPEVPTVPDEPIVTPTTPEVTPPELEDDIILNDENGGGNDNGNGNGNENETTMPEQPTAPEVTNPEVPTVPEEPIVTPTTPEVTPPEVEDDIILNEEPTMDIDDSDNVGDDKQDEPEDAGKTDESAQSKNDKEDSDKTDSSKDGAPVFAQQTILTPEAGAYLANFIAANEMFTIRYHDRQYFDGYDGVWGRVKASFSSFKLTNDKDVKSKLDQYTIHLGKDLWNDGASLVGVMIGYGYSKGHSTSDYLSRKVNHHNQGFALGAYGTYHWNEKGYVDVVAQYLFMRNSVESDSRGTHKYRSKGLVASIETGYAFDLNDKVTLEPQAQLIWMGVKDSQHIELDGSRVSSSKHNLQTRVGARLSYEGATITPYAEVNYIHNSREYTIALDGDYNQNRVTALGAKNQYQLEVGMTKNWNRKWISTGSLSYTKGSHGYKTGSVKLDVRYNF